MAVHDFYYATAPESFSQLRWRLQVIAELGIGRLLRREQMSEDEAVQRAFSRARQ